jgi:hypothetical protein
LFILAPSIPYLQEWHRYSLLSPLSAKMLLSRGGITLAVWIAVFTVLTSIVIGLRLWAIRLTKRAFRPDDYMVFFAYVSKMCISLYLRPSLTRNLDLYAHVGGCYMVGDREWSRCAHIRAE